MDILGWEFAFELNETAKQIAAEAKVHVQFRRIPRDVLDKRAVEQGDIQERDFLELRVFSTKQQTKGPRADRFSYRLHDAIRGPSGGHPVARDSLVSVGRLLAIDRDFRGDTFHNQWQSYPTRDLPNVELSAKHVYKEPGSYVVMVKVIDLLGCDTTTTIPAKVE